MKTERVAATEFRRNMTKYMRKIVKGETLVVTSNGRDEMVIVSPEWYLQARLTAPIGAEVLQEGLALEQALAMVDHVAAERDAEGAAQR